MSRRIAFLAFSLFLIAQFPALAESAPLLMNFQGRLTNNVGSPVTVTTAIRLSLIQDDGMTEVTMYQEDTSVTPDGNGVFGHVIGTGTPVGASVLEEADFITNGAALYVEMSIGGTPLLPRTQILSTGYAIEASRLDGKSASEIIGQAGGNAFANEVVRNGARLEWVSSSQVNVRPGVLGFSDAKVRKTTSTLVWDVTNAAGPLGLDTGMENPNTWYYLYAIPDSGDDTTFTVVGSIQAPTQVGGTGPNGHGIHRYLGSVRNNSSSNILAFHRTHDTVMWEGAASSWRVFTGSEVEPLDVWTSVDTSVAQPETSTAIISNHYYDAYGASTSLVYNVAPTASPTQATKNIATDWGDGVALNEMVIQTIGQQFFWKAQKHAWSNNGPDQVRDFRYAGYLEDLADF